MAVLRSPRIVAIVLIGVLAACGRLDRPAASPVGRTAAGRSQPSGTASGALEQAVHERVNAHRQAQRLPPLALDPRISQQARLHSLAMAKGTTPLGHDGFDERVEALRRVMPCRQSAENVAYNQGHRDPAAETVRGWLASRGHRRNIEGPYELTGIGSARNAQGEVYFTQIFVGR